MYHAVVPLFNGYGAARKSCCERGVYGIHHPVDVPAFG